jgi:hypothetical protein
MKFEGYLEKQTGFMNVREFRKFCEWLVSKGWTLYQCDYQIPDAEDNTSIMIVLYLDYTRDYGAIFFYAESAFEKSPMIRKNGLRVKAVCRRVMKGLKTDGKYGFPETYHKGAKRGRKKKVVNE